MLAAIVLEGVGVPLHAAAPVSIFRYVNSGPQSLLIALCGSLGMYTAMVGFILPLFATTIILQFTSTFLASDLSTGLVVSKPNANTTWLGISSNNLNISNQSYFPPYWQQNPQSFQAFAEYTAPIQLPNAPSTTVKDTGLVHRALLPVADHSVRTSIRDFTGEVTVLDTRTVCMQPQLHNEFALAYTNTTGWLLVGNILPSTWVPGLVLTSMPVQNAEGYHLTNVMYNLTVDNATEVNLTSMPLIQLPLSSIYYDDAWGVREKLEVYGPGLVSTLDPRFDQIADDSSFDMDDLVIWQVPDIDDNYIYTTDKYNMSNNLAQPNTLIYSFKDDPVPFLTGRTHVMLNISYGRYHGLEKARSLTTALNHTVNETIYYGANSTTPLNVTPKDEWLLFTIPQFPAVSIAMTLCFDSIVSVTANVTATTDTVLEEPDFMWDPQTQLAGTQALRDQIGVLEPGHPNATRRSIMQLSTTPSELRQHIDPASVVGSATAPQEFLKYYVRDKYSWDTNLCTKCTMPSDDPAAVTKVMVSGGTTQQIFQEVLRDVGEMHLALQAYVFMLARVAYYDWMPYFDLRADPTVSWFQRAIYPQSHRGLTIVTCVLAVHFLIVACITIMFFSRTKTSRIGDNAWQCLAQAQSAALERHLKVSTMARDGDVKQGMSKRKVDAKLVKLKLVNRLSTPRVLLTDRLSAYAPAMQQDEDKNWRTQRDGIIVSVRPVSLRSERNGF